jgi:hypothetical protein
MSELLLWVEAADSFTRGAAAVGGDDQAMSVSSFAALTA